MSVFRMIAMAALLCIVFSTPVLSQQSTSATVQQLDQQQELILLRLERRISDQLAAHRTDINSKMASELEAHRKYLQELDDKFYERARFWFPVFSALVTIIVAAFLWYVGKTQKEAFETAQLMAVSKATELAQKKVDSIVLPEAIINQIRQLSDNVEQQANNAVQQAKVLREALVKNIETELMRARDEIVSNKQEIIESTLDEAIRTKFSAQFDVMSRLTTLESNVSAIAERTETIEELIRVEAVRAAVVRAGGLELRVDLPASVKAIAKAAEVLTKLVLRV
jgi:hypothetical protein